MQPIAAPSYLGNSDLLCADINSTDRTRKRRKSLKDEPSGQPTCGQTSANALVF
jgi:hypothetical protein